MTGGLGMMVLVGCSATSGVPNATPGPQLAPEEGTETTDSTVPEDTGTTPPDETVDLPTAYEYEGPTDVDPVPLSLQEVATAVNQAVVVAFSYRADPVVAVYQTAMAAGSRTCPAETAVGGGEVWEDTCTTSDGSEFDGSWVHYDYNNVAEMGLNWSGDEMWGTASIATADGNEFEATGRVDSMVGVGVTSSGRAVKQWVSSVSGTFSWTGAGAEGTWLELDGTPHVSMLVNYYVEIDGVRGQLDGEASFAFPGFDAVSYGGLEFGDVESGWTCPGEPAGSLAIRGEDGFWYILRFDGVDGSEEEPPGCDGCAAVSWRGQDLGVVCPDFTPWIGWSGSPW